MDRIICDICGSAYPQTADQCPICGYPRQGEEKAATVAENVVRAKVKGGRFSNKNVRKRRKAQAREARSREGERSNRGLWITIILLLLAITLVSAYILLRFWDGWGGFTGENHAAVPKTTASVPTTDPALPCESLLLDITVVELEGLGKQTQLSVKPVPENTSDTVAYASADPSVAQVSGSGLITAIGEGQTTITVTCGAVTEECTVICLFLEETTAPPQTTSPPETTAPPETNEPTRPAELKLDQTDVTFFQPGEAFTLRVMLGERYVDRSTVTWTSSDSAVAEVENGVVTAVGPGTVNITAQYEGRKAVCIVRCRFEDTTWRASHTDVTLPVGHTFQLSVVNNSGEKADVVWTMDKEGIVSMENGTVTGLAAGTVTLTATIDDVKVWCIVRVKE